jgi:hypothetical protein
MTTPAGTDFRDRKTGLVVFGIGEIVMGLFFALGIPLMLISRIAVHHSPDAPQPPPMFFILTTYLVAAAAFVWLGIGSILARRWARAILLSLSGVALCGGVLGCVSLSFLMPHIFDTLQNSGPRPLPPEALLIVKIVTASMVFVMYILIPGSILLFYRSPHVKRTCEVYDPVERWTDRCPLPVLAICLPMGFGGIIALGFMGNFHGFPFFGMFVSGGAGTLLLILIAGLVFWLARGLYRLQIGAWWATLGLMLLSAASNTVTFWGPDLGEIYAKMGIDPRAAAMVGQMSGAFHWLLPLSMVPWVVWLLCIRRYFTTEASPPVLTDGAPPVP